MSSELFGVLNTMADQIREMRLKIAALQLKEQPFYVWKTWTPFFTGWAAGSVAGDFRYCVIEKTVFFVVAMTAGNSNSNVARVTAPVISKTFAGAVYSGSCGWAMDDGVTQSLPSRWIVIGNIIQFNKTLTGPHGWTATGVKRVYAEGFYEID